ncbi:MAG TPA: hypothetical protein VKB56_07495 [Terriglobales bacterium]|nr:hypothetical protein [Terriglobales bacterium]
MQLLAQPWWVNLLIVVPIVVGWFWRARPLNISLRQLGWAAAFAGAFGFVEAAVVVYLRAASGLLPGYQGTLADVVRLAGTPYRQDQVALPPSLLTVEVFREAATILMLVAVAMLAARVARERWAAFLWCFAIWDVAYYTGLWATIRWPQSLTTADVLFLIPVPWIAQVWFPLLMDAAVVAAVLFSRRPRAAIARTRARAA